MLLQQLKRDFVESLVAAYPEGEVDSFFNLLTEKFLGMSRLQVALDPKKKLSGDEVTQYQKAIDRLLSHEPIQYILGETEFFGLPFKVNRDVLIPRPETEELVEWILSDFESRQLDNLKVLDIGTGSGCIAISLARHLPNAQITAIDISDAALETARLNAVQNEVQVNFVKKDILKTTNLSSNYDIIVSNPPYVRQLEKEEMQRNVLENEPSEALYVNDDEPLVFYDRIAALAGNSLVDTGSLYFEINQYLGDETVALLTKYYFSSSLKKDIFGNDRMLRGQRLPKSQK